ncbi:hypothetical protein LPC08_17820 [Roseomonas sp. OT10]|uniref:hypothetical protein n=1 Tax=Roseomonas cutis TaxID=2897332 RepID=UPI001E39829F|nr:hypothetical protein [Roseomonas sp. OT10]UFN47857.1 hypothetical protein LPC08_17820 [Roseomonas sp. OT10]
MPPRPLILLPLAGWLAGCATGVLPPEDAVAAARGAPASPPLPVEAALPAATPPDSCAAIEAEMSDPAFAAEMMRAMRENMQAMRGLGLGGQVARTALGLVPYAGAVAGMVLDGVESAGRAAAQERMHASLDGMLARQEALLTRYGAAGCHRAQGTGPSNRAMPPAAPPGEAEG